MCYTVNFETEILHHHGVTHAISILIQRQSLGEFEVILFLMSIQSLPSFANMSTGICFCFDFVMWTFLCSYQNSLFLISHICFPTPSADSSFTHLSGIPARNTSMESFILYIVISLLLYCYQSTFIFTWEKHLVIWSSEPFSCDCGKGPQHDGQISACFWILLYVWSQSWIPKLRQGFP